MKVVRNRMNKLFIHKVRVHKVTGYKYTSLKNTEHKLIGFLSKLFITKSKHKSEQFRILLLTFILVFCAVGMWAVKASAMHDTDIQKDIARKIIRFHVIANSDTSQDQALKLLVKDDLVKSLSPLLSNTASITDARRVISDHLDFIKETAEASIKKYGYSYPVRVSLEDCYFPLKVYGNCTFPPGTYEALRVRIGLAEGKNWWCVMFPPLCFVDETYCVVDKKTDKKLKHLLTDEEYNAIVKQKKPVKIKFKIWESIKKLFR